MQVTLKSAVVPVTPFAQNCTLLWNDATKQAAIVDPGGDVPRILEAVDGFGLRVHKILLTHGHLDHAGGALELRRRLLERAGAANLTTRIAIEGPDERDRFLLDALVEQGEQFGLSGLENVTPDRWLRDGEEVSVAGIVFEVLHCPGHTPGHIVFVQRALGFAQLGDVLFKGSIGRTDFPYGDHAALVGSIRTKLLPLGDEMSFICGHGSGSTIGAERVGNPFLR